MASLKVLQNGASWRAPDSSMSSPYRSSTRASGYEKISSVIFTAGHSIQIFPSSILVRRPATIRCVRAIILAAQSRKPRNFSNPLSRNDEIHSGSVTPLHSRTGGGYSKSQSNCLEDARQQSHRLPLPPITISNASPFHQQSSAVLYHEVLDELRILPALAHVGKRGSFLVEAHLDTFMLVLIVVPDEWVLIVVGFNETGEMCAMKEVNYFLVMQSPRKMRSSWDK
ncbi:mitogen-activated protein kinase kinase kinase YODA, partial [Striga asiatica]